MTRVLNTAARQQMRAAGGIRYSTCGFCKAAIVGDDFERTVLDAG
jgi:hypothetical protein